MSSSVLVWPNRAQVDEAVRRWVGEIARNRSDVRSIGYFGSYARGDWGVGSDLDLVAVVASSDRPRDRRALEWDLTKLPVPAEILVYTESEWNAFLAAGGRFAETLAREMVWVSAWERVLGLGLRA